MAQADNKRNGIVLANMENDYMKIDTNYLVDIPSKYRFLDAFKLDKSRKEAQDRSSTHIAFVQGNSEPEYFGYGLPSYTKKNFLRCNKQTPYKKLFNPQNRPKPKPKFKDKKPRNKLFSSRQRKQAQEG